MRLSEPQAAALRTVRDWGPRYMPFADQARTFQALARRGLVAWHAVGDGTARGNGYELTDAGRAILAGSGVTPR